VAVVGHLRGEKDPLRAALAARGLPAASRIRIVQAGRALDVAWAQRARAEQRKNPRYAWLGELGPARARGLIARSRLLALTSRLEGGANVIGEALAAGTPIVASRIDCTEAILGPRYPGLFRVGATRELRALLLRAEREPGFVAELARRCRAIRPLLAPARERAAWWSLIRELRA
jgi:glycosyltransferase involved in cell wall biosynthesis